MQFLDIVNLTFDRASRTSARFRARNYHVIPIGAESGLIQWVDGTVPAFQLFSKYQQRTAARQAELLASKPGGAPPPPSGSGSGSSGSSGSAPAATASAAAASASASASAAAAAAAAAKLAPIARPSEIFFKKLTPALKKRGITNLAGRSKWPRDMLAGIHEELVAETPSDLISRELWMSASSPAGAK
jgi:PI-3-kinase-related kinase SMG-1